MTTTTELQDEPPPGPSLRCSHCTGLAVPSRYVDAKPAEVDVRVPYVCAGCRPRWSDHE